MDNSQSTYKKGPNSLGGLTINHLYPLSARNSKRISAGIKLLLQTKREIEGSIKSEQLPSDMIRCSCYKHK